MIIFVAPKQETWCMESFLRQEGRALARRITILNYENVADLQELPIGAYIFAAIDQLSRTETELAHLCWDALSAISPSVTILNHPAKVLCRYDLLKTCFELQRNTFRVFRASQFYRCRNFPVFIRCERRHAGSLTGLLHTPDQLRLALIRTLLRGHYLRDLLIVEYRDTVNPFGIFREYNASIVAGCIIPQAVVHNHNWITKWSGRLVDPEKMREQCEYLETNPHAEWLKETFALANIQYGRIDYGVKDGVPQVWEINTNPQIVRPIEWGPNKFTPEQRELVNPARFRFFHRLQVALAAIDTATDAKQTIRIRVSRRQRQKLEAEKRWLHRGKQWNPRTGRIE